MKPTRRGALLAACHPAPTVAVTVLTALLSVAYGHSLRTAVPVVVAVLLGQLTIGWSNDLIDLPRDLAVGRSDKPIARGDVSAEVVRRSIVIAGIGCVAASFACGVPSALVHLGLGVAAGWAYNLGLKSTVWSPVPYAVAFAALPAVVTLARAERGWPPAWAMAAGALIGVGLHLLNALPDLAEDIRAGVLGLPQRLGPRTVQAVAPLVLLAASAVVVLAPGPPVPVWAWAALVLTAALAAFAARATGRTPFLAAIAIAAVDVGLLVGR
ncbi:UbiA family prenyltransferase [Luteipulveratus sp. YIM 133132]|uniref:UbiA family prenyltransferase n=1 Tax=Luteipulveratus flavus TaxID=3031728 RepID=A0ABT6CDG2_9MICO|nr:MULTISPECIES: UbiA family prenyltransferase [unclassified Luteipulveratus]MDE9365640.1 UbiA family prenyltransferase [Luteipulveratus sp. YIM 133132]MDF8266322.1 UbiA family prenyltransferase [Luteipulveratus sp. YIM 133296]